MATEQKYKVNNLAKDLNIKSKQLTDIITAATGRAHPTTLSPDEFGMVIDQLTSEVQIDSIDKYINGVIGIGESKEEDVHLDANKVDVPDTKEKKDKDILNDKAVSSEILKSAASSEKKDKVQKPDFKSKKPDVKNEQKTSSNKQDKPHTGDVGRNVNAKKTTDRTQSERMQQLRETPKPFNQPSKTAQKKNQLQRHDKNQTAGQTIFQHNPGTPVESGKVIAEKTNTGKRTRIVDTRTSSVDLSKYDEKLENFVSESKSKKNNQNMSGNQRIKKQGARDHESREKDRLAMEKRRKQELEKAKQKPLSITIPDNITVGELASRLKVTAAVVVKHLMLAGVMVNVTQTIDFDTALYVAEELGAKATREVVVTIEQRLFDESEDNTEDLVERAPVVVVMGHVDHGKTSLLDKIRHANVTAGEAGGITQHIGAYRVNVHDKDITFLDTPGHEAFTAMRARGAKATDIAILVVAADDGIMPQTIEAIRHAKDAELEVIVAINKMDKPGANPDQILQSLTKYDIVPEVWGGDTMVVPVSALTGMGIDDLLDDVLLIAEMKEYRANPNRKAKGIIIEAKLDKGKGPVATVLVQNGTLNAGDVVIAGTSVGHVRAMVDDKGRNVKKAGPSVPVEIVGLSEVPMAGDEFNAVEDERMARELANQRREKQKEDAFKANSVVNLDDLFAQISDGVKELKIIVKADVGGSAEAVKASLEKLSTDEVKVKIIHSAVGGITEGDVMFAAASNAIIVGFNVRPDKNAIDSAERQKVDIRTYRIIYECIEEIEAALKGMLAPTYKESLLGHAEVRQAIHVPNVGTVAGSYVQDGKITRTSQIRVVRDGIVIFEDKIQSLRRFKEDVREVAQGYECGVGLERFNDIKEGDILEAFEMVEVQR